MLDYERITARDLKRIVNRGEATPAAIGLFVVYDFWEREHERRSIVDNKLLRHIESKWAFSTYANELEYWLELGTQLRILELRAIEQASKAHISLLKAEALMRRSVGAYYALWYKALHQQATGAGLEVSPELPPLSEAEEIAQGLPDWEQIEAAGRDIRTNVASFLGYLPALGAAGSLLGIDLSKQVIAEGNALAPWAEGQKNQMEKYQEFFEHWPDRAKALRELTAIGSVRPSSDVTASVVRILGAYLSPNWIAWARAGVKLREIAESSSGIMDLIRHAEIAAAEIKHE